MRTKWTIPQRDDFIAWHEKVISQYPQEVAEEFRKARETWMPPVMKLGEFIEEQVKERKKAKADMFNGTVTRPQYQTYN